MGHLLKLALVVLGEVANILLQRVDVLAEAVLLRPRLLVHLLDLLHVLVVLQAQLVGALCLALLNLLLQLRNQTCNANSSLKMLKSSHLLMDRMSCFLEKNNRAIQFLTTYGCFNHS